jgi:hypothetical protein
VSETVFKIIIGFAILLVIVSVSFVAGVEYDGKKWASKYEQQALLLAEAETKQSETVDKIITKYVNVTHEVPVYVPSKNNSCLVLDGAFRVFHDAASSGVVSTAASGIDATPVPIADLAKTIAENYTSCSKNADKLMALQEWAKAVSK